MSIYQDKKITIFFGDAQHAIDRCLFDQNKSQAELEHVNSLLFIKQKLQLASLFFTKQIHGAQGFLISHDVHEQPEADFLVTNKTQVGLGIYTADCLPIIIYDPEHHAVALAHAGWMGSVQEIAIHALQALEKAYGTKKQNVKVFFGPAAGPCCYVVQPSFREKLAPFNFSDQVLAVRDGHTYFDLVLFNKLQLSSYGVLAQAFNYHADCTIHTLSYCSYRRDNKNTARNVTLVALSLDFNC